MAAEVRDHGPAERRIVTTGLRLLLLGGLIGGGRLRGGRIDAQIRKREQRRSKIIAKTEFEDSGAQKCEKREGEKGKAQSLRHGSNSMALPGLRDGEA